MKRYYRVQLRFCLLTALLLMMAYRGMGQDVRTAAANFLATLDEDQKAKASYTYTDDERFNWSFVPRTRHGLPFEAMNAVQRTAAMSLLKASLSDQGYAKATGIFGLEAILRGLEGRNEDDDYRNPQKYYFTIFGMPSSQEPWGWRIEGHHLSLNFSSVEGLIESSTPSFMGANPAKVRRGPDTGKQVLQQESDLGFLLVNSFSDEQLKTVVFSARALPEIVTGNDREARSLEPKGIPYTEMNENQRTTLMRLLDVYVRNYQLGFSRKLMDKIVKSGVHNLSFAWAGSMQPGAGHYYRIQGPMLLIEYDNTQNNANHVHTVVRDLTNDFAEDILKEHYEKEHER